MSTYLLRTDLRLDMPDVKPDDLRISAAREIMMDAALRARETLARDAGYGLYVDLRREFDERKHAAESDSGDEPVFLGMRVAEHHGLQPHDFLIANKAGTAAGWISDTQVIRVTSHPGELYDQCLCRALEIEWNARNVTPEIYIRAASESQCVTNLIQLVQRFIKRHRLVRVAFNLRDDRWHRHPNEWCTGIVSAAGIDETGRVHRLMPSDAQERAS